MVLRWAAGAFVSNPHSRFYETNFVFCSSVRLAQRIPYAYTVIHRGIHT